MFKLVVTLSFVVALFLAGPLHVMVGVRCRGAAKVVEM